MLGNFIFHAKVSFKNSVFQNKHFKTKILLYQFSLYSLTKHCLVLKPSPEFIIKTMTTKVTQASNNIQNLL